MNQLRQQPVFGRLSARREGLWKSVLLKTKGLVWYYGGTEHDGGDGCPVAWRDRDIDRYPRYVRFEQNGTCFAGEGDVVFYVPFASLIRLGPRRDNHRPSTFNFGEINDGNMDFENNLGPGGDEEALPLGRANISNTHTGDPRWVLEDNAFIDYGYMDWKLECPQEESIPVRLQDGSLAQRTISSSADLTKIVQKILGTDTTGNFKTSRHYKHPLRNPLYVIPLSTHKLMIRERFRKSCELFINHAVDEANDILKLQDSSPNATPPARLAYCDKRGNLPHGYIPLSKDPFQLFTTYIHNDDWHAYMTDLQTNGNLSVRGFMALTNETYNVLEHLLKAVGKKDLKVHCQLTKRQYDESGLPEGKKEEYEADAQDKEANMGRSLKTDTVAKRLMTMRSMLESRSFSEGITYIEVRLDQKKMAAAAKMRAGEQDQKTVMGNTSASDIARVLGWEADYMASGLYASEWLHLSAFSWGGYADPDVAMGYSTSQCLENLVFGTSETNSLMTRYERAWQRFFATEQAISDRICKATKKPKRQQQGELHITTNDFDRPILYDAHQAGRGYHCEEMQFDWDLRDQVSKLGIFAAKAYKELMRTGIHNTNEGQMLAIASEFPFIAYSIKYEVRTLFAPVILGLGGKYADTFDFYPFRRPMYHAAEAVLDDVLWDKLKEAAELRVSEMIGPQGAQKKNTTRARKEK